MMTATRRAPAGVKAKPGQPRRYTWIPDVPDKRDEYHLFRARLAPIPEQVDLAPRMSRFEDQDTLGSCTAHAITDLAEYLYGGPKATQLSRLMLYWLEREEEHTLNEDAGAYIRNGMKAMARSGTSAESFWPYVISKFRDKPSIRAYRSAAKHRFASYHRIVTIDDALGCIAEKYPLVFGFAVYTSFESREVERTGMMPMPNFRREKDLGGHAVVACGYDNTQRRIKCKNSWGVNWGDKGYFYMPYDYFADNNLCDDMWTARRHGTLPDDGSAPPLA